MEFLIIILVLLVTARLAGELFERIKQPAIIGELLAGIILGPTLLNFINPLAIAAENPTKIALDVITTLSIFFVVFFAGLEMKIESIWKALTGKNLYISLGSFVVTFLFGLIAGLYFLEDYISALFLGLCIAITALPVGVKILIDLDKLHTNTGHAIIGTAIVHDLIAITGLGLLIGIGVNRVVDTWSMVAIFLRILIFIMIIFTVERVFHLKHGLPAMCLTHFMSKLRSREAQFSVGIIVALVFAVFAEFLGISYVIGAFYGGLIFSKKLIGERNFNLLKRDTRGIAMGFFAPIFIAYIGTLFNACELYSILGLFFIILIISIVSMFVSGYLGARAAGYTQLEAKIIGVGINARGMMEMVVALIGLKYGLIDGNFFSILVVMAFITTLITPGLLKYLYSKIPAEKSTSEQLQSEK